MNNQRLIKREKARHREDWTTNPPKGEYKETKDYLVGRSMRKYSCERIDGKTVKAHSFCKKRKHSKKQA